MFQSLTILILPLSIDKRINLLSVKRRRYRPGSVALLPSSKAPFSLECVESTIETMSLAASCSSTTVCSGISVISPMMVNLLVDVWHPSIDMAKVKRSKSFDLIHKILEPQISKANQN